MNSVIKHWRLFDSIAAEQIKQLDIAGICVRIEDNVSEIEFTLARKVQFVKSRDIYITTTDEKQETLLHIMFVDNLELIGYDNDYSYRY